MNSYKRQIEYLCNLIERYLLAKKVPCHISGGTISNERVRLFLTPHPHTWLREVYKQIPSLALYLGMNNLDRGQDGLVMEIPFESLLSIYGDRPLLPRRETEGHFLELEVKQDEKEYTSTII